MARATVCVWGKVEPGGCDAAASKPVAASGSQRQPAKELAGGRLRAQVLEADTGGAFLLASLGEVADHQGKLQETKPSNGL